MAKFETGDAVRVTDADGKVFKGEVRSAGAHDYDIMVPAGHRTVRSKYLGPEPYTWNFTSEELEREPFGDYGLRIEPWAEEEQPTAPFTLLDDEGRKALKAGDRVLVEVEIVAPEPDIDGEITVTGQRASGYGTYAHASKVFALLPPAEKPIAVGDYVSIATQLGTKGKVLAFASAGAPVVEFADGDGLTARAFDASVLEVIS